MPSVWDEIFAFAAAREATKLYSIAFTPRSGSSRLGDILCKSQVLGSPKEWFNHKLRRRTVVMSGCRDLAQFYRHLKTVEKTGNIFGMELTWQHAMAVFVTEGEDLFDDIPTWFYLRRRDYVAQGVSLHKAVQSGVFHSIQLDGPTKSVSYDGDAIMKHILRIFQQETGFEHYFKRKEIQPIELWYEDTAVMEPQELVTWFAESLSLPQEHYVDLVGQQLQSEHKKMYDDKNREMIRKFREEFQTFIDYWDKYRGMRAVKDFIAEHPEHSF